MRVRGAGRGGRPFADDLAQRITAPATTAVGPQRLLVLGYGLFVVAAGSRAAVQLATQASRAPVAYLLSALAALVYAAGFVAMRSGSRTAARAVAVVELAGVVAVGVVTTVVPDAFGDATVWSHFGSGYLLVPLVIPVAVLAWAGRH